MNDLVCRESYLSNLKKINNVIIKMIGTKFNKSERKVKNVW